MKKQIIIAAMLASAGLAGAQMFAQMFGQAETWTPAALNPIAWYKAENNALDSSGSRNGMWTGGASYTTGKVGVAFNLFGTNSIALGSSVMPSNYTASAWINARATVGDFFSYGSVFFRAHSATQIRIFHGGGASGYIIAGFSGLTTGLRHVVIVHSGNVDYGYQNGLYVGSVTSKYTETTTRSAFIGHPLFTSFSGVVDDVLLFNRALTATEIKKLYDESVLKNGAAW